MAKSTLEQWDETAANNTEAGTIDIDEGCAPSGMNNAMRELMAQTAKWIGDDTVASAATTDLGSVPGRYVSISGTTTITGLGTIKAGTVKYVKFAGALTLTHNATSLILPGATNITTAAGDTAIMVSEGSGNWRCIAYQRADGFLRAIRIGTNITPTYQIDGYVSGSSNASVVARNDTVSATVSAVGTTQANVGTLTNHPVVFIANNTEQARLVETGELVINSTAVINSSTAPLQITRSSGGVALFQRTTTEGSLIFFEYAASTVGSISVTASATAYNTSSDYRLPWKEGASPISDPGAFIDALKPYYFPIAGHAGFFAHEFAEVSPISVTGEKDALDENGKPEYQSMQASTADVIANMIAEMQSLRLRVAALEGEE